MISQKRKEYMKIYSKIWRKKNRVRLLLEKHKNYIANKEHYLELSKIWRKNNIKKVKKNSLIWLKKHPWYTSFRCAKQRCTNPKTPNYRWYGGRGIKFLMTMEDFKFLWFRDKAYLMKQPTIDRIDNGGDYELNNCRFVEKSINSIKSNIERKHKQL